MEEYRALPPETGLPEEYSAPAPEIYPPPEEGTVGTSTDDSSERRRREIKAQKRTKVPLLIALAGAVLWSVFPVSAPKSEATGVPSTEAAVVSPTEATIKPSAETSAAVSVTEPSQPSSTETAPIVLTDAERLVAVGTWKNDAESEWVHFSADGTGWWYDGTFFGRMVWKENADGSVSYAAGIAYLSPELQWADDAHTPERDGDCLHSAESSGSIALLADEDRFTCPGLRFGEGTYLPDASPIDASLMDGLCGKTAAELLSDTSWHMEETSNLGIPVAPSLEGGKSELYTDLVYVQSMDFSAGTIRFITRDGGLLWNEDWTQTGDALFADAAQALERPIILEDGEERAKATIDVGIETTFGFLSDVRPGDTEYNNMHFLWGRQIGPDPTELYLLITGDGIRLGIACIDLFPDNYTLLTAD